MSDMPDPPILEDDAAWHKKEGLLWPDDSLVQQHFTDREALIAKEKSQRSDRVFRENMSETARNAAVIVENIRKEEMTTLWTNDFEESLAKTNIDVYPGMMFSLARERMESSKLFKIVRKMPKGALLHCHFEAMVEFRYILEDAFEMPGLYFKSPEPLNSTEALGGANVEFERLTESPAHTSASIWSSEYTPGAVSPLNQVADSFPDGGRAGFVAWMATRTAITPSESLRHHDGPGAIWKKFGSAFMIIRTIIYHPPILRRYVRRLCQQLHDDGVEYADVRGVFTDPQKTLAEQPSVEIVNIFAEEVEAFKNSAEGKGFWGMRIIWTWVRVFSKRSILEGMKACIKVKKARPDLIAGFDFVGQEDIGRPLKDLIPEIIWFEEQCKKEHLNIPFFFHAGETLGTGDDTDENLFDAIMLGTRRIGHGFSLFKHPLLIDMVKERSILIESCPVSNEVLRYTSSIRSHPLPALLARGVPCALANDDPAILFEGKAGMSHDFWQALQGWDNLGFAGLGSLAENSVRWATLEDYTREEWLKSVNDGAQDKGIRGKRLRQWHESWEQYCQWVVSEFGTK
ncbi:adenosine deaminase family protein [Microthyrium microscopicum]|uniref:adenosine deaminase n=1 Tax=Microthyrium microscopicum TaxID=703497 RepID=A0A6A6U9A3_9PEZI|nr:adenosine deaminase family protein [Microthyrium microscopicum]